ncbi:hypothetical protein [Bacteroides acidifaciens]|uniref:hypothetical protein n=1 Tax=Bacteroides acidifaciens TaxID=85831 RepID=UPI00259BE383|nr:hypothetical protein [Bacteroides acidifaciens]
MKEPLRYKICLWMVWLQLALIPIVYLMMWAVDGTPYIWRWNLLSWVMLAGYLIGILALPLSRGLDKPKFLKWWLRIDFVATILLFIPFYFTFIVSKANFVSERGKYVLFTTGGGMAKPALRLGKSEGLFIKELYDSDDVEFDICTENWIINEDYGYSSLKIWNDYYKSIHVFPIDSSTYHQHNNIIDTHIDSIFHAGIIGYDKMKFVMPEDFSTIEYCDSSSIEYHSSDFIQLADIKYWSYETGNFLDSVLITLSISENDVLPITDSDTLLVERVETERQIKIPKESVPWMSPTEAYRFINYLRRR